MGLLEKRRARKFFIYVQDFEENDPKSHEGLDLHKVTARELISYAYCSHLFFFPFAFNWLESVMSELFLLCIVGNMG